MKFQQKRSAAFKRQIVEEIIGGMATVGQQSRRHQIAPSLIHGWKAKYLAGGLNEGPTPQEGAHLARIAELERMVGRLAMENDLLKKAREIMIQRQNEPSSPITARTLALSNGAAKP